MLLIEPMTGRVIDANTAAASFLEYPRDQLVGKPISLINQMPSDQLADVRRKSIRGNQDVFEFSYRTSTGKIRQVEAKLTPVQLEGQTALLSIVHDVTEKKHAEKALRLSEDRYRAIFQASLDSICLSRVDSGVLIDVNQAFLALFGYEGWEVIGYSSMELGLWDMPERRVELLSRLKEESILRNLQIRFRKKNGETFWALTSALLLTVNDSEAILFVIRDTTESKEAEQRIAQLAFFDQLTGLPNRALFIDRVNVSLSHRARDHRYSALLYLDLNNFRSINETFGYRQGDAFLSQLAQVVAGCIRSQDTLARLGGDDFAVLMSGVGDTASDTAVKAELVGKKIVAALSAAHRAGKLHHEASLSIGVKLFNGEDDDAETLLKQAEIAMYRSKEEGGTNLKFFDSRMEDLVLARSSLEKDLREAIREDQFVLYYQPQYIGGSLAGVEALIRWDHPSRGRVAPSEFIRFAEDTGLMLPIGDWVLRQACRQISHWSSHPVMSRVSVSVNISAQQFSREDFVEGVLDALAESGALPSRLKLELTESMLVSDVEQVVAKMKSLRSNGICFSLDDFGTGYSSLAYLKRLPLEQLKIDQSFVRDMLESGNDAVIAKSIISLGKSLGMCVVAEGVETIEQHEFLKRAGCHGFQGYFFGKPVSAEELERTSPLR